MYDRVASAATVRGGEERRGKETRAAWARGAVVRLHHWHCALPAAAPHRVLRPRPPLLLHRHAPALLLPHSDATFRRRKKPPSSSARPRRATWPSCASRSRRAPPMCRSASSAAAARQARCRSWRRCCCPSWTEGARGPAVGGHAAHRGQGDAARAGLDWRRRGGGATAATLRRCRARLAISQQPRAAALHVVASSRPVAAHARSQPRGFRVMTTQRRAAHWPACLDRRTSSAIRRTATPLLVQMTHRPLPV